MFPRFPCFRFGIATWRLWLSFFFFFPFLLIGQEPSTRTILVNVSIMIPDQQKLQSHIDVEMHHRDFPKHKFTQSTSVMYAYSSLLFLLLYTALLYIAGQRHRPLARKFHHQPRDFLPLHRRPFHPNFVQLQRCLPCHPSSKPRLVKQHLVKHPNLPTSRVPPLSNAQITARLIADPGTAWHNNRCQRPRQGHPRRGSRLDLLPSENTSLPLTQASSHSRGGPLPC